MADTELTAAILFSDVKGYSKLLNDADKVELLRIIRDEVDLRILNPENHFYSNTWGDGYVVCCHDAQDAAEIALKMVDAVRNRDWKRARFAQDFALRIGLHMQSIRYFDKPDGSKDVAGVGVDTAARIEPVAEPNSVYCSDFFQAALMQSNPGNIKTVLVGKKQLAKDYSEMTLYQVLWQHEQSGLAQATTSLQPIHSIPKTSIPMPQTRQQFSDKQRHRFLKDSFEFIKTYFQQGLNQLEVAEPAIETEFEEIPGVKFVCTVYLQGNFANKCVVGIVNQFRTEGITYYEGRQADISR